MSFTDGFVGFLDLTLPSLSLPLADYVMSLEVAGHTPRRTPLIAHVQVTLPHIIRHTSRVTGHSLPSHVTRHTAHVPQHLPLEIAEHVPNKFEAALVRNLHAHNRVGLILSWGILNQPGVAHINNHNQSYVSALFEVLGYHRNLPFERALRLAAKASPWLSRNVLVLERWTPRAKGRL